MQKALFLVRQELGPGAAVLHTREVPRRGLSGWLGGRELELAASDGSNIHSRLHSDLSLESAPIESSRPATPTAKAEKSSELCEVSMVNKISELPDESSDIGLDLLALVEERGLWDPHKLAPMVNGAWIEHLRKREISDEMIRLLAERVQESLQAGDTAGWTNDKFRNAIAGQLRVGRDLDVPESNARIIAAVGPTGVGKTTTIAKLAARAKFDHGKRVGLVTIDTYRIAAVDQLRIYSEIMKLPMRVAASVEEVKAAVDSLADCDQIFIDTAGRSPRDEVQMRQLGAILNAARPHETYLVVSATSCGKVLENARRIFERIRPTALIMTKIDEVETIGNALEFLVTASIPISYVTNGQDVPNAIEVAKVEDLARHIL